MFFDIPRVVDKSQPVHNMIPPNDVFIENAKKLRVRKNDLIICYDHIGMLGAPRAWFLFRLFGANNVRILNGGLLKWKAEGRPVESEEVPREVFPLDPDTADSYAYSKDLSQIVDLKYVHSIVPTLGTKDLYLLDARPAEKFNGTSPETRPGLRSGHIPGSVNIPYKAFLNPDGMTMKNESEVKKVFADNGINIEKKIIASCMLGNVACNILFALWMLGKKDAYLYDGSWCEYVS